MRMFKGAAWLLLALWVPVTTHCALETVPEFGFLQCCCGGDETPKTPGDCQENICGGVESGLYKIEDNPTAAPGLAALLAFAVRDWAAEPPTDSALQFTPVSSAPPELPRVWQFSHRTALPPRAPSLAA